MHILIANDDGIFANGIRALADAAVEAGHRVTIFAPDSQRSAASHSISLTRPLHVQRVPYGDIDAYSVDGTPADCVRLGLYLTREDPVDCVISGINNGSNRGTAILYSGTVAAAVEAALCEKPALAVSLCSFSDDCYEDSAKLGIRVMEWAMKHPLPRGEIYNLNVPYGVKIHGVRSATLSHEYMTQPLYAPAEDGGYMVARSEPMPEPDENCDLRLTEAGFASLTVIGWNRMAQTPMPPMDDLEWK